MTRSERIRHDGLHHLATSSVLFGIFRIESENSDLREFDQTSTSGFQEVSAPKLRNSVVILIF